MDPSRSDPVRTSDSDGLSAADRSGGIGRRMVAPAAARNREPIAAVLDRYLPVRAWVLEVASGSGEHGSWFVAGRPGWVWQPSDPDPQARSSIDAWAQQAPRGQVLPALALDVLDDHWPMLKADAMVCINLLHISPPEATRALFRHAAVVLPPGGFLILYGPFRRSDRPLEPGNVAFDADLRRRNPQWGLRALDAVRQTALAAGFDEGQSHDLPANNCAVAFRRLASAPSDRHP